MVKLGKRLLRKTFTTSKHNRVLVQQGSIIVPDHVKHLVHLNTTRQILTDSIAHKEGRSLAKCGSGIPGLYDFVLFTLLVPESCCFRTAEYSIECAEFVVGLKQLSDVFRCLIAIGNWRTCSSRTSFAAHTVWLSASAVSIW